MSRKELREISGAGFVLAILWAFQHDWKVTFFLLGLGLLCFGLSFAIKTK